MISITKTFRFLISFEFFAYLLGALVLVVSLIIFPFKLQLWDVFNLLATKIFIMFALLNRFFGLLYEIKKKKLNAILSAGIVIVIVGLLINYSYRFTGTLGLAEGEDFIGYDFVERGRHSMPPYIKITIEDIKADPFKYEKTAKIRIRNEENKRITIFPGDSINLEKGRLKIIKTEPAPRFLIADERGMELHSAFVKLNLYPVGREDYFLSPAVAHRFYLSLTGREDKPLHMKVLRGKLTVVDKDIAVGEVVEFEGLKVSFPEVSMWALMEMKYYPGNVIIIAGIITVVAGIILKIIRLVSTVQNN